MFENKTTEEIIIKFRQDRSGGAKLVSAGILKRTEYETKMLCYEDELQKRGINL